MPFNTYFIVFPTLSYTLTRKFRNSLPLDIPESFKWYSIQTEPLRIGHYREKPPPPPPPPLPGRYGPQMMRDKPGYRAITVNEEEREES